MASHILPAQSTRSQKVYKGPRALGLLELPSKGKTHLLPITILIDGKFYDASVYKASPVPMALWNETVYEAERTGVSQGLFTVTGALENTKTNAWTAEGTWESEASILAAKPAKKTTSSEPRGIIDESGPPVLRRRSNSESPKSAPSQTPPATSTPSTPPATGASTASPSSGTQTTASNAPPATQPAATTPPASPSPAPSPSSTPAASPSSASTSSTEPSEPEDKDHPVLRRGKPAPEPPELLTAPQPAPKAASQASRPGTSPSGKSSSSAPPAAVQLIPAISDADGPEPRSYAYVMKPEEEEQYRKKMLVLAADEIRARAKQLAAEAGGAQEAPRKPGKSMAKPVQPKFEDTQLHVFDLSASNEPVLVLTARAHMPSTGVAKESSARPRGASELQYILTLVTREDINGDFHKIFANVTDTQHLDVLPQYDLIDAVDADGDGRGELLFRQVSDAGSAYVVYRVIGDQLWPLFEGTPQ